MGIYTNARPISEHRAFLKVAIACSLLLPMVARAQYAGGIGRGAVQSVFVPSDCLNVPGGTAQPGTPCDDQDDCTAQDIWNTSCTCTGTLVDTDGDLTSDCEDGCPTDPDKTGPGVCGCFVPDLPTTWYADQDGDGLGDPAMAQSGYTCVQPAGYVANNSDPCPAMANAQPGDPCDDMNGCTTGDVINESCMCTGTGTQNGIISGNSLLADGLTYYFNASYFAGAVYEWSILPDNTGWELDTAGSVATVVAPPINAQVELCVSVMLDGGCIQYACTELYVMDVGLQETGTADQDFSIRPNPGDGRFELVRNGAAHSPLHFDVEDASGRPVSLVGTTNASNTFIDLGSVPSGVYMLRVWYDQGIDVIRLMVR